jgi:hypothetical protein
MRKLIAYVSVALLPFVPLAAFAGKALESSAVMKQIQERGAEQTARELWSSGRWNELIEKIETGEKRWLEVAKALRPGTDAGASEMLHLAAGVALVRSPREVLLLLGPGMSLEAVCGFPDMADNRYKTQKQTVQYLDARIEAVKKLSGPDIASLRDQCLVHLNNTKTEVLSPRGPFSGISGSNYWLVPTPGTARHVS